MQCLTGVKQCLTGVKQPAQVTDIGNSRYYYPGLPVRWPKDTAPATLFLSTSVLPITESMDKPQFSPYMTY